MASLDAGDGHARRMDRMYRHQRHIYDLTRKYYLLGRDEMIRDIGARPGESILELGCGTGRNLALISRLYPQCDVFGLDISEEMLATARKALPLSVRLMAGDASRFSASAFGREGFNHIVISYALSMIPDWKETISAAVAALAPGGRLQIVDFGQQEKLPAVFGALLRAWLDRFHVTPRRDLVVVARNCALRIGATWEFRSIYRGYAWSLEIRKPSVNDKS